MITARAVGARREEWEVSGGGGSVMGWAVGAPRCYFVNKKRTETANCSRLRGCSV